ncbi:DUF3574 domain-containing protein [Streptomyces peucetius]|uniref:DUF3574 domain-containing protein n=1 Tax=Streptomyces peucetius TaxID=1950 RepID=A0ABY6IHF3_STRPE|nr:DUF3574 domain-containing protein [Streptomyces peucetius]UYQ66436.1 DUF3574 domain-containing protein [Streptomyces peucetius]
MAVAGAAVAVLAVGAPTSRATLDGGWSGSGTPAAVVARGEAYIETRLFFGTQRPDGGPDVTDAQFTAFIDRSVTPAFPEGLTVQQGRGQWRDSDGVIERERSYELILLYPAAEARARGGRIERIRDAYARMFAQESVARLDEPTRIDF